MKLSILALSIHYTLRRPHGGSRHKGLKGGGGGGGGERRTPRAARFVREPLQLTRVRTRTVSREGGGRMRSQACVGTGECLVRVRARVRVRVRAGVRARDGVWVGVWGGTNACRRGCPAARPHSAPKVRVRVRLRRIRVRVRVRRIRVRVRAALLLPVVALRVPLDLKP
jgi:hypothetical protein